MTTDELKQTQQQKSRLSLGIVTVTRGVASSVPPTEIFAALGRHFMCDWGDVVDDDWKANDEALENGTRLLSVYKTDCGETIWIITEWDREATTILLPSEY